MLHDQDISALRALLHTQSLLVQRIGGVLNEAAADLAVVDGQAAQIAELARLLTAIEAQADLLTPADLAAFDPAAIPARYIARRAAIANDLAQIGATHWPQFVRSCQAQLLQRGLDPLAPYEALLTAADQQRLRDESYDAQLRWSAEDYHIVGLSGLLAALTDVLLVGTPASSPLTGWLKAYNTNVADDWFGRWARTLEASCRVPYDVQADAAGQHIAGMAGRSHRLQSLGHDPVLGLIAGVLDILRGTISGFSYDHLRGMHTWVVLPSAGQGHETNLIAAILRQLGHLISDVATPMGLPAPLLGLLQGINAGSIGPKGRTVGQIARWMYLNGYDLRHFLIGGLGPAVIEIVLRGFLMLRHYATAGETPFAPSDPVKQRSMLLAAHGIAALANAGKIALTQGNPLAINLAQWYALVRYLGPSLHYWLFDAQRLRLEHLAQISDPAWDELLLHGDKLLRHVAADAPRVAIA